MKEEVSGECFDHFNTKKSYPKICIIKCHSDIFSSEYQNIGFSLARFDNTDVRICVFNVLRS